MAIINKIDDVFKINTTTSGAVFLPVVTALNNGGYVVAWTVGGGTANSDVVVQMFNADNFRSGGEFVASTTNTQNSQFAPDIATLGDGSFVVTWMHEFSATDVDVRARRFDQNGTGIGNDYGIATTGTFDETLPHITAQVGTSNYVVTWGQDGIQGSTVQFVFHDKDHNIISGPGPVDSDAPAFQHLRSDIAGLRDGNFVVAYGQFGIQGDIYTRKLVAGAGGGRADTEEQGDESHNPSIAALEGGGYVVVWTQGNGNDGPAGQPPFPYVLGRRFDQFGNYADGSGFFAPANPSQTDQTTPVVHGLVGGGFILVWDDGALGLRGIVYDKNNVAIDGVFQITPQGQGGSGGDIGVTQKMNGDIVVVWGGVANEIDGQVIRAYNVVDGTNGNDQFATALSGFVSTLHPGFQSNDWLKGLNGNDFLQGFGGAQDILDGGDGVDTATYIDAPSSVSANLLVPAFNNGDALGDQYISIENLEGSFFGDQLGGDNGPNQLAGLDGQDSLEGNGGNDILIGGLGNDTMNGGTGHDQFFVDSLGDVVEEAVGGGTDRVFTSVSFTTANNAEIEMITTTDHFGTAALNLTGNFRAEYIIGNDGANVVTGGGSDTLWGRGGNDQYFVSDSSSVVYEDYGAGIDRVFASRSYTLGDSAEVEILTTTDHYGIASIHLSGNFRANYILGNAANNVISGGAGSDTLAGLGGQDKFYIYTPLGPSDIDRIEDFVPADDTFWLDSTVFTGMPDGVLASGAFQAGFTAFESDDRILYDKPSGRIFFDSDGGGGIAAIEFAQVNPGTTLVFNSFIIL